jgi:hypothetical protein
MIKGVKIILTQQLMIMMTLFCVLIRCRKKQEEIWAKILKKQGQISHMNCCMHQRRKKRTAWQRRLPRTAACRILS